MDFADLADVQIEAQLQAALRRHAESRNARQGARQCRLCGIEIPARRREVLPHVDVCVGCAEAG